MEIRVNLATKSYPFVREDTLDAKGIIVCTGKYNNFDEFFESVNKTGIFGNKCPHYYIDGQGRVYQVLPENYKAKYAGKKSDDEYIQITVQEPVGFKMVNPEQFGIVDIKAAREEVCKEYKSLLKLCDTLCIRHSLEPDKDGIIISQYEGYNSGIANKCYGIEHIWRSLDIRIFMPSLRRDIRNDLMEGKGYFHDGIDYSYVFDPEYYKTMYPDLGVICNYDNGKLFKHFIECGMNECRKGKADFDVVLYIQNNPNIDFGRDWPEYYRHYCQSRGLEENNPTEL